jgi:HSP90 family molecular chaperone
VCNAAAVCAANIQDTMNKMKPIWMRSPKEVTETEYTEFYKSTFKAWDEPLAHAHFSLEGQVSTINICTINTTYYCQYYSV